MTTTNKTSNVKNTVLAISTVLLLGAFAAAPAMAKPCKNVHIEVTNKTGQIIKIIDLDYWDSESEKWRSVRVPNERINNNRIWQTQRNLSRVNSQDVALRVEYKTQKWSRLLKKWIFKGKKKQFISGTKKCTKNAEYIMSIR